MILSMFVFLLCHKVVLFCGNSIFTLCSVHTEIDKNIYLYSEHGIEDSIPCSEYRIYYHDVEEFSTSWNL